jgi:transcription initiation factor TFIIIB Brf1 subunit/transcription initiation factor TFIIB
VIFVSGIDKNHRDAGTTTLVGTTRTEQQDGLVLGGENLHHHHSGNALRQTVSIKTSASVESTISTITTTTTTTTTHTCRFIYDPETGEEVCAGGCGRVAFHSYTVVEDQLQKEKNGEPNGSSNSREALRRDGFLVSKATDLDFSCGGFLSTKIDSHNKDAVGKSVNSAHFNRIRFVNNYIQSATEMGTYKHAIWMVKSFSDRMQIPYHVQERAAEIFKKTYYNRNNIHNSKNVVCASIYYACKEAHINRKMPDIASAAMEPESFTRDIFKTYRKLMILLSLDVPKTFPIAEEISYLGGRVGIPESVTRLAREIYFDVKSKDRIYFGGKSPRITAALLIWMAAHAKKRRIDVEMLSNEIKLSQYNLEKRVLEHLINKPEFFSRYAKREEVEQMIRIMGLL